MNLAQYLPVLTVLFTCLGLWLSGSTKTGTRIRGWTIALVTQSLLVLFGILTEYRTFILHTAVVLVLSRNIKHNWRKRESAAADPRPDH